MGSSRQVRTGAVVVALVVLLAALPGVVAAETRTGGSVVVGENEVVDGDLDVFAGSVVVRGTVTGDVNAFGGSVDVDGRVDGDVNAFGGTVDVGPEGVVGGSLEAAGGDVTIAGQVDGDATVGAETVRLTDTAAIGGDLEYDGTLERSEGATVDGTVTQSDSVSVEPVPVDPRVADLVGTVYTFLASLLFGALLLLVLPGFSRRVATTALDAPLRSGGVGLLVLFAVPLVLVLFAITIVGLPITFLGAFLFVLVAWMGSVYGRVAVGAWLLRFADVRNRWAALVVGLLVVGVLTLVPILGGLVEFVVTLLGLGALATVLYRAARGGNEGRTTATAASDEEPEHPGTA
ncbi:bactofilin family protein [Halomarina ordinaria]|uniref:Polymer-forming cytoskeletal protein n=1 Tax=Halomarina ordinaria TaxID=3033939 RepID=A0ABD5UFZ3_9EURY|nr:polymer-forming cytoskeletal protein [Halomarina sp. PSRA2]